VQAYFKIAGGEVLAIPCDVSSPDRVEAAIRQVVERFGRLDMVFNNAGVENKAAPVHEIDLAEWDRIIGVNLRGTFLCMKHELAQMVKQRSGVIVNTSSGAGHLRRRGWRFICRIQARDHWPDTFGSARLCQPDPSGERSATQNSEPSGSLLLSRSDSPIPCFMPVYPGALHRPNVAHEIRLV
jgi:NAD(P)-dependent dehydrogenase (short-subunit alcohol dehydrogenase family)